MAHRTLLSKGKLSSGFVSPHLLPHIFIVGVLFPLAVVYARYLYAPCDDAYIFLVYVRNFIEGNGLTFNGAVVEGFSSVSWVLLLSALGLTRVSLPVLAEILSLSSGLLALYATYFLSRTVGLDSRWALLPSVLLAATGDFAFYMAVGLEQVFFTSLVALCVAFSLRPDPERILISLWFPFLMVMMILTRPEGALIAALLLLALVFLSKSVRGPLRGGLTLLLLLVPVFLIRRLYFGYWLPNTYYVKSNAGLANWELGVAYLENLLPTYGALLVIFIFLGICGISRKYAYSSKSLILFSIMMAWILYILGVGGDNMVGGRVLLPVLPLFYVWLVSEIHKFGVKLDSIVWGVGFACLSLIFGYLGNLSITEHIASWRKYSEIRRNAGIYLRENFPADTLVALNPAGMIPYYSGLPTLDMLGLNDVFIAHKGKRDYSLRFGHQAGDGIYVLAQQPDVILLGGALQGRPGPYISDQEIWNSTQFQRDYDRVRWPGIGSVYVRKHPP